jgi:hypothetical protein
VAAFSAHKGQKLAHYFKDEKETKEREKKNSYPRYCRWVTHRLTDMSGPLLTRMHKSFRKDVRF